MFAGRYEHSIDAKNRLMIPARFRDVLAKESDRNLYVTVDVFDGEKFLAAYPSTAWAERMREDEALARKDPKIALYVRKVSWDAEIVKPDKQSRLVLSDRLIGAAGLGREVVLVGQGARMEVWDAARWRAVDARATERLANLQSQTYGRPDLSVKIEKPGK